MDCKFFKSHFQHNIWVCPYFTPILGWNNPVFFRVQLLQRFSYTQRLWIRAACKTKFISVHVFISFSTAGLEGQVFVQHQTGYALKTMKYSHSATSCF